MPAQGRLGDMAQVPADAHGCPGCPHTAVGPAISGSPNVNVNGRPAVRVGDNGMHMACCGSNMWTAQQGSNTVFINGKPAHRMGDMNQHCGGVGKLIQGSENVFVGDSTSGGGGGGGGTGDTAQGGASSAAPGSPGAAPGEVQPGEPSSRMSRRPDEEAPAQWQLLYDDGTPVRGWTSRYLPPSGGNTQEMIPDAQGHSRVAGLRDGHLYDVTVVGMITVRGKLHDHEGKPLAEAAISFGRAFGGPLRLHTDAGGAFEARGLVEEEPFEVRIERARAHAAGRFVDEEGKPRPGVRAVLRLVDGHTLPVTSDAEGCFTADHDLLDEGYSLRIEAAPAAAEGRFTDEEGRPEAGVRALLRLSSGRTLSVASDGDGRFHAPGLLPGESYTLTVE